jgi:hypothetical protein
MDKTPHVRKMGPLDDKEETKPKFPKIDISIEICFEGKIREELEDLDEACEGDRLDTFGHLKYWKCMIKLKPFILEGEIKRSDVKEIAKKIGFSEDQVVRSLDRFVNKGILIKSGSKFHHTWKLNKERLPILYFLCFKKKLTHIVRYYLEPELG